MVNEMSIKVKSLIQNAIDEAKNYDDSEVNAKHLLMSILLDGNSEAVESLKYLHVDIENLFETLATILSSNISNGKQYSEKVDIIPSHEFQFILNQMDHECTKSDTDIINPDHLMLGLLKGTSDTQRLLNNLNVTYNNYKRNFMENNFNGDSHEGPIKPKKRAVDNNNSQSKTPGLDSFGRDITEMALEGKIDNVIGREKEIKRLSTILARRKKNNPLIIGEPGVGKTAIIEGLAILINKGEASKPLLNKKIISLDLASLVAGTKYRGQFEERIKQILDELKDNPDIILFIDEMHTMMGAGNANGSLDASNIFKPALASGEIQVIGATTLDEYRENIEKDTAFTRRFGNIILKEPTIDQTIEIISNIKGNYEKHHKVVYSPEIVEEIVKLSNRYITDRAMPDKAIDILDEVGAATNIDVVVPEELLDLKEQLRKLKDKKAEMVKAQQYEEAAAALSTEKNIKEELDKKTEEWESGVIKHTTIIDSEMVNEVVSTMTGIPLTKMSKAENKNLKNLDKTLKEEVIGQDKAIEQISKAIKRSKLGIKDEKKPIGSFMFLGSTGVGKTFLAKMLAQEVFGDAESLFRVDMSEYMDKFSMTRLIGAPPGYIGHEEGGKLTEYVRRNPYSLILFDEIEKGHEDIFNLLLQLLDEGHLTDSLGRKVNFKNTLIIMTSNVGASQLAQYGTSIGFGENTIVDEEIRAKSIIKKALKDKFKPEFLNRIDDTIIFNPLLPEHIDLIIKNEINIVKKRIADIGYNLELTKGALKYIAEKGYHKEYGARPLNRAIQQYVEDPIADAIVEGELVEGGTIKLGHSEKIGITTKIS